MYVCVSRLEEVIIRYTNASFYNEQQALGWKSGSVLRSWFSWFVESGAVI